MRLRSGAPRRDVRRLGLLAATLVVLSACGGGQYTYVGYAADNVFFRVPSGWKAYNTPEMLAALHLSGTAAASTYHWIVGYDSAPAPSINDVLLNGPVPSHPAVYAYVRTLDGNVRDHFSLSSLRNARFQVDQLAGNGLAELLLSKPVQFEGGFHGEQDVFDFHTLSPGSLSLEVNQVGVVDPATSKLYFIMVFCDAQCYATNQNVINDIANSWTVKEP